MFQPPYKAVQWYKEFQVCVLNVTLLWNSLYFLLWHVLWWYRPGARNIDIIISPIVEPFGRARVITWPKTLGFGEGYKDKRKKYEILLLITSSLVVSLESMCINIYLYFHTFCPNLLILLFISNYVWHARVAPTWQGLEGHIHGTPIS